MDRSAGMLKLSRRLDVDFRVLRYDRRGYGRSFPHDGPFTMDAQVDDLVGLLAGRRAVLVGHSYGGNVALATADRHPDLVAGVAVYETPLSWEPWWPGTTAGSIAVAAAGKPQEAAERFMRRMIGDQRWEALPETHTRDCGAPRVRRWSRSSPTCVVTNRGSPSNITVPVITSYGSLGAAASPRGDAIRRDAARLSGRRAGRLSPRRAAEPSRSVQDGGDRPAAAQGRPTVVAVRSAATAPAAR